MQASVLFRLALPAFQDQSVIYLAAWLEGAGHAGNQVLPANGARVGARLRQGNRSTSRPAARHRPIPGLQPVAQWVHLALAGDGLHGLLAGSRLRHQAAQLHPLGQGDSVAVGPLARPFVACQGIVSANTRADIRL